MNQFLLFFLPSFLSLKSLPQSLIFSLASFLLYFLLPPSLPSLLHSLLPFSFSLPFIFPLPSFSPASVLSFLSPLFLYPSLLSCSYSPFFHPSSLYSFFSSFPPFFHSSFLLFFRLSFLCSFLPSLLLYFLLTAPTRKAYIPALWTKNQWLYGFLIYIAIFLFKNVSICVTIYRITIFIASSLLQFLTNLFLFSLTFCND